MEMSRKQRFHDIAHFKRQGDLCLFTPQINDFWPRTLEEWVKQGAPQEILSSRFRGNFLQLEHFRVLREFHSGVDLEKQFDIGDGNIFAYEIPPVIPTYEPRIIAEDERTVTLFNEGGITVRIFKDNPSKMPTFLDSPVKDRATWNEYKHRLNPESKER